VVDYRRTSLERLAMSRSVSTPRTGDELQQGHSNSSYTQLDNATRREESSSSSSSSSRERRRTHGQVLTSRDTVFRRTRHIREHEQVHSETSTPRSRNSTMTVLPVRQREQLLSRLSGKSQKRSIRAIGQTPLQPVHTRPHKKHTTHPSRGVCVENNESTYVADRHRRRRRRRRKEGDANLVYTIPSNMYGEDEDGDEEEEEEKEEEQDGDTHAQDHVVEESDSLDEQAYKPVYESVPFKSGNLCVPVHGYDDSTGVDNLASQYCFLCATSKESSRESELNNSGSLVGEYGIVDERRSRLQRIARCQDYDKLLSIITSNVGRMDEECLIRAVQTFYESALQEYVPGEPHWSIRVIREHIREHELNPQWQAWTSASDIRTLIRINLNNGVCVVDNKRGDTHKLDIPSVKLHIQLLRQLEREVAKALSSTT
jgi:hypothetical protein